MRRLFSPMRWRGSGPALAGLLALGLRGGPAVGGPPDRARLDPHRLVLVLHGYTSSSAELAPLIDVLQAGDPPDHAPYHTHAIDFGVFSRVAHDHNLDVETLADLLNELYEGLPTRCEVCAARAEAPVKVALITRSLGGVIAREALLRGMEDRRSPWNIDRLVTLGTPWMGSTLTRFATGFQSIVVNGLLRTVLFGFVAPSRGGNFGRVNDAQARALRLGSPFLWDANARWSGEQARRQAAGEALMPTLHVLGLGSDDAQRRGDGVSRLASANVAPLFPASSTETLLTVLRHAEMWNRPPTPEHAPALRCLAPTLLHFVAHGSAVGAQCDGQDAVLALPPGLVGHPSARIYGQAFDGAPDPALLGAVARLEPRGDLGVRVELLGRDGQRRELAIPSNLSLFASDPEWSRNWPGTEAEQELEPSGRLVTTTLHVGPSPSRQLYLPDLSAATSYSLSVELRGVGLVDGHALWVEGPGRLPSSAAHLRVYPHQANLLYVIIDEASLPAPTSGPLRLEGLRLTPVEPRWGPVVR
jgi:hypothetical protein